jgi:type I restriction enzyme S subunit
VSDGWPLISIGELCERVTSGGTPSRSNSSFYSNGDIPWVKTGELRDAMIFETEEMITASAVQNSSAKVLPPDTILLAMYGATVGALGILGRPAACNQASCALIVNSSLADSRWLFYSLLHIRPHLVSLATGAAQQNLSGQQIAKVKLRCPPLRDQQVIAEVLSALDDKIAALQGSIVASERLLSRELGSLLAKGSTQPRTIGEVVRFRNNERRPLSSAERSERVGNVPYYGATTSIDTVDEAIFDDRLVLVGEDGSVVNERTGAPVLQYIWGPAWVNNHAHVLEGTTISTELLFHVLGTTDVRSFVTGAVQPKLSMANLKKVPVNIPDGDHLLKIENEVQNLTALERSNTSQIRLLQELRDTLLPALMSGKLRVKDAERAVEDVL